MTENAQMAIAKARKDNNLKWKILYFVALFTLCGGFYFATQMADYIWHWERVPDYFYFVDDVEVRAEVEGVVTSIHQKEGETVVVVEGDGESEHYTFPGDDLRIADGDDIEMGDVLGTYREGRMGLLVSGLIVTIEVSIASIIFGILLGLFTGLARISTNPFLKWSAITYIELIRGTPLLVQMLIWYYVIGALIDKVLENIGLPSIPALWWGIISLAIFAGAYVAEIVRAGIQSINKGQMEAARSLGMTKAKAMAKIILPQAFRRILPPLAGQFISLIKDSSLLGIIAIRELTKATREGVTTSLMPYELYFVCGIMYLLVTFSLSMFVQYLEKRTAEA